MIKSSKEGGYTLTELMIVIAIVGVLAFPEVEQVRTAAKLTGVQGNFRSVITTIYGLQNSDDVATKLTSYFGNSLYPEVEDMTNPITNKMGVATALAPAKESTPAVYVLDGTLTAVPSEVKQPEYKGAVVAIIHADNIITVYGCDETGRLMTGLQKTIQL
ncbi:type II secretion system protein [Desulfosporosinus lacus]|uniref:Prepilin-type N-terminal cleavage/methylation domain-containing protein n=1 Tax=Desulfosporosinus lacus DSM 15449 TaxID=1121420 RepID=A0A1M5Z1C7_9FIRM|nr:prepilin-type N-terminal cleavage/methylation domain-containing protein [Desulfosporosinus lacus]SHI17954.1 prepilin-type N-terminal cleavage/methylation domain-containing protein [Desulfosporosinus lacus DSM 15449]